MANEFTQLPLTDVVLVQLVTKEHSPKTLSFQTSDEIKTEEVIKEGEAKELIIKNQLIAKKEVPDLMLGYDLTFKDNVMSPEVMQVAQGGTIEYDPETRKFKKYEPPAIGTKPNLTAFDTIVYSEIVGDDGATGEYAKFTFPNCKGGNVPVNLKDGEYYSNEYKVKSRPAIGQKPYTLEMVDALPSGVRAFGYDFYEEVEPLKIEVDHKDRD